MILTLIKLTDVIDKFQTSCSIHSHFPFTDVYHSQQWIRRKRLGALGVVTKFIARKKEKKNYRSRKVKCGNGLFEEDLLLHSKFIAIICINGISLLAGKNTDSLSAVMNKYEGFLFLVERRRISPVQRSS